MKATPTGEFDMPNTATDLNGLQSAVEDFMSALDDCGDAWAVPIRPGKWTPSQISEHVARSLEESGKDMLGQRSKLPQLPAPVRFLARHLGFKRVLKNKAIPAGAKANRALSPLEGPLTPSAGQDRLRSAWLQFEQAWEQLDGPARSHLFGTVPAADYVRFQEIHTRHHQAQLPR
ncbi:MAG: hypothetical protein AMS21_05870 [Gemmatimonas sp. SG8_38_2]|nr:MAG: hypothetical protein AMS21_05870 [Gemmatimonas sp. SG8_38_2]